MIIIKKKKTRDVPIYLLSDTRICIYNTCNKALILGVIQGLVLEKLHSLVLYWKCKIYGNQSFAFLSGWTQVRQEEQINAHCCRNTGNFYPGWRVQVCLKRLLRESLKSPAQEQTLRTWLCITSLERSWWTQRSIWQLESQKNNNKG